MPLNYPSYSDTFVAPPPSGAIHIIWNILLSDKEIALTPELIEQEKITHIVAILPSKNDFLKLNTLIPSVKYSVIEYHNQHTTKVSKDDYNKIGKLVDDLARETNTGQYRNILIFCNNGYQRSLPFLVYYLTQFHPEEAPTIDKAIDMILPHVNKESYMAVREDTIKSMKELEYY